MAALAVGLLLLAYELLRGYRLHRPFRLGLFADVKPKKRRRESGNHREGDNEA